MSLDQRITLAVQNVFKQYDKDNSGQLDTSEIKQLLKSLYKLLKIQRQVSDEDIKKMLIAFDSNNDGKINKQELRVLVQKCLK